MSEFDKLMKQGSKREDVKQRQASRKSTRSALLWILGISFFLAIIPPHIGLIVFIPALVGTLYYAGREWMG